MEKQGKKERTGAEHGGHGTVGRMRRIEGQAVLVHVREGHLSARGQASGRRSGRRRRSVRLHRRFHALATVVAVAAVAVVAGCDGRDGCGGVCRV